MSLYVICILFDKWYNYKIEKKYFLKISGLRAQAASVQFSKKMQCTPLVVNTYNRR